MMLEIQSRNVTSLNRLMVITLNILFRLDGEKKHIVLFDNLTSDTNTIRSPENIERTDHTLLLNEHS